MGVNLCCYSPSDESCGVENHAVIAMIARTFLGRILFEVGTARKSAIGRISTTSSKERFSRAKK